MVGIYDTDSRPAKVWLIPVISTMLGSMITLLPFVTQAPMLPSVGLLIALGWRMVRPEMWGAWVALPLGMIDDLIGGAPLGTAAALWTVVFLGLDISDHRRIYRDSAVDWQLAAGAILFVTAGGWALAWLAHAAGPLWTIAPQTILGILLFPAAGWLCAAMDRWRLGEGAATTY